LAQEAKEALEIGLGEALRIGKFWLGTEFLLMGLSKQIDGALAKKLAAIGVRGRQLRGALRGTVHIIADDWQKQQNVHELGAKALPEMQEVDPSQLADLYGSKKLPNVVISPRLLSVLRESFRLAEGEKVSTLNLLCTLLQHQHNQAVIRLFELIAGARQDPVIWMREMTKEEGGKTLISMKSSRDPHAGWIGSGNKKLTLEVLSGPLDGYIVILESDSEWTRAPGGKIAFPWDEELGKPQSRFLLEQGQWLIEPFNSIHNTYILSRDTKILEKTALQLGDMLKASKTWMMIKDIS